jgi:hypothetical protein
LGPRTETSLDVIDALDQFFVLAHRSATLDGDLQARAVQFCPPVVEGTAAGCQIVSPAPILLDRASDGKPRLNLPRPVLARVSERAARVDQLAQLGLLRRGGRWHRLLRDQLCWERGHALHVWTGHLVRPRPGISLYLTASFNRRCGATVGEQVYEADEWVPLVLSLSLPQRPPLPVWLKGDVACLLPLSTRAKIEKHTLPDAPEVGRQFNAFFDHSYWDTSRKPARYRRLIKGEPMDGADQATCKFIYVGGDIHEIGPLAPVTSASGPTPARWRPKATAVTLRNLAAVRGTWDGHVGMTRRAPLEKEIEAFRKQWVELYGEQAATTLPSVTTYLFAPTQGRRELLFRPWVFVATPPGWSTVVDGAALPGIEGLRGIMSTDVHHSVPLVFRLNDAGSFAIPRDTPLARLIPIPRRLLRTTFALTRFEQLDSRRVAEMG